MNRGTPEQNAAYEAAAKKAHELTEKARISQAPEDFVEASKAHEEADRLDVNETSTSFDHFHMSDRLAYRARELKERAEAREKEEKELYGDE